MSQKRDGETLWKNVIQIKALSGYEQGQKV